MKILAIEKENYYFCLSIIRMSCDMELEHLDINKMLVTISWSEICICYKWRRIVFVIDSLVPWDDVGKKLEKKHKNDKTHYYYTDLHATLNGFSNFMWARFRQFFIKNCWNCPTPHIIKKFLMRIHSSNHAIFPRI